MTKLSIEAPVVGTKDSVAEPKVGTAFSVIQTWANGEIDGTNNIKSEGLIGANCNKEIPKVAGAYGAQTVREGGKEFEVSATRPALVMLELQINGAGEGSILVGGVQIGNMRGPTAGAHLLASFIVPAGVKWRVNTVGTVEEIKSSYLIL